ncbi:MAG: hypothetical protein ACRCYU_23025, partial [Nocardioides sp.]
MAYQGLLTYSADDRVLQKLLNEGVLSIGLRDQLSSLEELWFIQNEKAVDGLCTREQARRLDSATRARFRTYSGRAVAAIFRERVLDAVGSVPTGRGQAPARFMQHLTEFAHSNPSLDLKKLHAKVFAADLSTRSQDRILSTLNAAYENNVAIASEANFDGFSTPVPGRSSASREHWALPAVLATLGSVDVLSSITFETVAEFRSTSAFADLVTVCEDWRTGKIDEAATIGVFGDVASKLEYVLRRAVDPGVRALVQSLRLTRTRSKVRSFLLDSSIDLLALFPPLSIPGSLISLAMGALKLRRDSSLEEEIRLIGAYSAARTAGRTTTVPVVSGKTGR